MRRGRDLALTVFLLAALLSGVAFDLASDDVELEPVTQAPSIFDERSVYCPPPPRVGQSTSKLVLGSPATTEVPVGIDGDERVGLAPERIVVRANQHSSDLVGYGAEVLASALATFTGKTSGLGAARCSKAASPRWYFAEGSSALGAEQRFVIYNPFPDEAVVGISLFTPKGPQSNANLSEGLAVPAGETVVVELNEFIRGIRVVGAEVVGKRGGVIAWRALQVSSEDRPQGVQFTLGAAAPASEWFFPGGVEKGIDERVSLLNPSEEEAVATISIATQEGTIQPPKLLEVVVPPRTLLPLPLVDYIGGSDKDVGGASVVVRTSTGALVAERTVYYDTRRLSGVASEVGAARTGPRWFLAPRSSAPRRTRWWC